MTHRRLKGMILAAGFGTRLMPLTKERPKSLMEVLGCTLIEYALMRMQEAGVESIVINTHYLADQIVKQVGHDYRGIPITYLYEAEILGTGGALKNARSLLQSDNTDVLIQNSDIFIELDMNELLSAHRRKKALATLVLTPIDYPEVGMDEQGQIQTLLNYVDYRGPALQQYRFCGVHVLSPEAFDEFPDQKIFSSIDAFYAPMIRTGSKVMGFNYGGYYCDAANASELFALNMRQLQGDVWIADNVKIASSAVIGPNTILGSGVVVGENAHVANAVVLSGTEIRADKNKQWKIVSTTCEASVVKSNCP